MGRINSSFQAMKIQQKTPIRVLHRRPLAVRERTIESLELLPQVITTCEENTHNKFLLRVTTEAGAYIKELVHGDLGRTKPCLADIIGGDCRTDIISLDVEEVFVDWPPNLTPTHDPQTVTETSNKDS